MPTLACVTASSRTEWAHRRRFGERRRIVRYASVVSKWLKLPFLSSILSDFRVWGGQLTRFGSVCAVLLLALSAFPDRVFAQPALPAGITDDELFGTVIKASKWPQSQIRVCWENPTPANEHGRTITRQAVQATWEANSAVRFTDWVACTTAARDGIHIAVTDDDEGAHTKDVGAFLNRRPHGMELNFTFVNWNQNCQTHADTCIWEVAVHEFGHALGFTHEHLPDGVSPRPECDKEDPKLWGDYRVTVYDLHSVMNYCNPEYLGNGSLSDLDVRAVQKFYGS